MMQSCGGCSANDVSQAMQVLMNPVTWLIVGTAVTGLLTSARKSNPGKKKDK